MHQGGTMQTHTIAHLWVTRKTHTEVHLVPVDFQRDVRLQYMTYSARGGGIHDWRPDPKVVFRVGAAGAAVLEIHFDRGVGRISANDIDVTEKVRLTRDGL